MLERGERLLEEILQPGGLLNKVVPSYEVRPQQLEMGRAVLSALQSEHFLVAEAPTGVGKTMAYLVPAGIFAHAMREPIVISSYTKALQDQILRQEVPRLKRLIHPDLEIAVLKGRGNYLCRRRWELFVAEDGAGPDGRQIVEKLSPWVSTTETGDLSEAPELGRRAAWALARISGDARFCRGRQCRPESGCFHKTARRAARRADLVIVNHSLLLADGLTGGILPEHRMLIIDEAHLLPDAALEPLTWRIRERAFEERVRLLGGAGDPGLSDRLRGAIRLLPSKVAQQSLQKSVRSFEEESRRGLEATRQFFAALAGGPGFPGAGERRRYKRRDCDNGLIPGELDPMLSRLKELVRDARGLSRRIEEEVPGTEVPQAIQDYLDAADAIRVELGEEVGILEALIAPEDEGRVYIAESSARGGASLAAVPLDTGPALREHVILPHASITFTSATLGAADDFAYFSRQMGLEGGEAIPMQLQSPFDLAKQILIGIPTYAPDPRQEDYESFLAGTIAAVVEAAPRKMLVLFTSYQTLNAVEKRLAGDSRLQGVRLLAQDRETPRATLMDMFRTAPKAILLGTASFWQGVDFPGRELEVLIVTRLPFPVPSDPRAEAIAEELEQEGRSSFREYALPEAVLKLRQGVGRLIRRAGDRGICLILDPRIARSRYGAAFQEALPVPPVIYEKEEILLTEVGHWFAGETEA